MPESDSPQSQSREPSSFYFHLLRFYDVSMQVFPPFMWTRSEIERLFPVGSAEREQAIKSLEHSYTMYDYYGKHIPHINEKENLLDEIKKRDAYIGKHSEFLHSAKACDLPRPDTIHEIIEKLILEVKQLLPNCRYKLYKSLVAARKSYQALLLKDKKTRTGFDDPKYVNVLGDMHLVGMAIYLGAKIMTEDRRLIEMASYAGIECDVPPPVA